MAWEPPPGIELDDAYYDIMKKINNSSWNKFARSALRLSQNDIEETRESHSRNSQEMKFQMFKIWEERNGAAATVDTAYAVLNHFIRPHECPRPDLSKPKQGKAPQNINKSDALPFSTSFIENALPPQEYCSKVERVEVQKTDPQFYNMMLRQKESNYPRKGKGRTFILNNMFHHHGDDRRKGSGVDLKNMKELWKNLGSEVTVHTDLAANDLKRELRNFSDECDGCDFCVIFLMSHGDCKDGREFVFGNDRGEVYVDEIKEIFDNIQARHLHEIPKLFFFQCCRGHVPDIGVPLAQGGATITNRAPTGPVQEVLSADATSAREAGTVADAFPNTLPRSSDVLIAHATQSGFQAFRHTEEGSWFVNAIANVFMRHAKNEHLSDLMIKVHNAVSTQSTNSSDMSMAMPEAKSTLRRKLFFFPGIDIGK